MVDSVGIVAEDAGEDAGEAEEEEGRVGIAAVGDGRTAAKSAAGDIVVAADLEGMRTAVD